MPRFVVALGLLFLPSLSTVCLVSAEEVRAAEDLHSSANASASSEGGGAVSFRNLLTSRLDDEDLRNSDGLEHYYSLGATRRRCPRTNVHCAKRDHRCNVMSLQMETKNSVGRIRHEGDLASEKGCAAFEVTCAGGQKFCGLKGNGPKQLATNAKGDSALVACFQREGGYGKKLPAWYIYRDWRNIHKCIDKDMKRERDTCNRENKEVEKEEKREFMEEMDACASKKHGAANFKALTEQCKSDAGVYEKMEACRKEVWDEMLVFAHDPSKCRETDGNGKTVLDKDCCASMPGEGTPQASCADGYTLQDSGASCWQGKTTRYAIYSCFPPDKLPDETKSMMWHEKIWHHLRKLFTFWKFIETWSERHMEKQDGEGEGAAAEDHDQEEFSENDPSTEEDETQTADLEDLQEDLTQTATPAVSASPSSTSESRRRPSSSYFVNQRVRRGTFLKGDREEGGEH